MKSDLIDIQVESRGNDVEISLSGSLGLVQLPQVKEKLNMLVEGPGCFFFLNLQNAHFTSERYLEVFLELLSRVKAQKSGSGKRQRSAICSISRRARLISLRFMCILSFSGS